MKAAGLQSSVTEATRILAAAATAVLRAVCPAAMQLLADAGARNISVSLSAVSQSKELHWLNVKLLFTTLSVFCVFVTVS